MKTKVLVTGANGQLGKTIKELYLQNQEGLDFTFTSRQELDISNKIAIEQYLSNNNFQYCINCAAFTNVEQAEKTPEIAFKINAESVLHLAKTCKKTETILIHISTDYVFDGTKNSPYTEEDIANPINEYGKSKLLGEKHIQNNLKKHFTIRTSWLYSIYPNNFLRTIVNKINKGEHLKITTSQKGTPTSCKDLGLFIIHLIRTAQKDYGIYNFSAQGEATWYDFAVQISKHFLHQQTISIEPDKSLFGNLKRPLYSTLDNSKSQLIYSHKAIWQDSVNEAVKNLIQNN